MQHKPCKPKKSCEKFCKPNQCSSHSDCPIPGMACIGGKCQPFRIEKCIQNCKGKSKRNKKCKEKRHQCEGYELCVKGYCLPRTCWNNGRCKKGYTCTDGICRPHIHTQCEHSNECKHKEKCIHGKCVGFCLSHQDCQAISKVCYSQKCIQPPRCHQENEGKPCKGKNVPRGLICQDGICIQIEIKECRNDDECQQGWFCRNDVCIFSCRFHYDCPGENQICTSNGCVDNVCKEDHIGNICGQLNMICEKNKCQRPCLNVYECPSSEFCALGICKPMKCTLDSNCKKLRLSSRCNKELGICMRCPKTASKCRWCKSYKDCKYKNGEACLSGVCQRCPEYICTKCDEYLNDCPHGYQCINKMCQPKQCGGMLHDCQPNEKCSQGFCITPAKECERKKDCRRATEVCAFGKCVHKCKAYGINCDCKADKDCSQNHKCKYGTCQQRICTTETDCPLEFSCKNKMCIPKRHCNNNRECKTGEICYLGLCHTIPERCNEDAECPNSLFCNNKHCTDCRYNYQCPQGMRCGKLGCTKEQCSDDEETNDICKEDGLTCIKSKCRKQCSTKYDCGLHEFCIGGVCKYKQCNRNSDCKKEKSRCKKVTTKKKICLRPCPGQGSCQKCSSHDMCNINNKEVCILGYCQKCQNCISCKYKSCPESHHQCNNNNICLPYLCGHCHKNDFCSQGICIAKRPKPSEPCDEGGQCLNPRQVCASNHCRDKCQIYNLCTCKTRADCPIGQICHGKTTKRCVPGSKCGSERDCKSGYSCNKGMCISKQNCTGRISCKTGEICYLGLCHTIPERCNEDAECPNSLFCNNKHCTDCRYNYQCPQGMRCGKLGCTKEQCSDDEETNDICKEDGLTCIKSKCRKQCSTKYDCGLHEFCIGGVCKYKQCNRNSDCKKEKSRCKKVTTKKKICLRPCPGQGSCQKCSSHDMCNINNKEVCILGYCQKCQNCISCKYKSCPESHHQCNNNNICLPYLCGHCHKNDFCSQGICIPKRPKSLEPCDDMNQCPEARNVCALNHCRDECKTYGVCRCKSFRDCRHGQTCIKGSCTVPVRCETKYDCEEKGMDCIGGVCKPKLCFVNEDCYDVFIKIPNICFKNKCINGECKTKKDCPNNDYDCYNSHCVMVGCKNCQGNEICQDNKCFINRCESNRDCPKGKECFETFCNTPCFEHVDCFTSRMICDTSKRHCVPPNCRHSTDCPAKTSCIDRICKVDYHLKCYSIKDCCKRYPNIPIHCFRGKCSPWDLPSSKYSLESHGNKGCLGCHCPTVQACKHLGNEVSCQWKDNSCVGNKMCGAGCLKPADCGNSKLINCVGDGYDGICMPEVPCLYSERSVTTHVVMLLAV